MLSNSSADCLIAGLFPQFFLAVFLNSAAFFLFSVTIEYANVAASTHAITIIAIPESIKTSAKDCRPGNYISRTGSLLNAVIYCFPLADIKHGKIGSIKKGTAPDKGNDSTNADNTGVKNIILYEPDSTEVFNTIVPEYLAGVIYGAICDSVASEQAARRTAMDAATSNAEEMIEKLNLHYNRARQASITQEITEIVGGAEGV